MLPPNSKQKRHGEYCTLNMLLRRFRQKGFNSLWPK